MWCNSSKQLISNTHKHVQSTQSKQTCAKFVAQLLKKSCSTTNLTSFVQTISKINLLKQRVGFCRKKIQKKKK